MDEDHSHAGRPAEREDWEDRITDPHYARMTREALAEIRASKADGTWQGWDGRDDAEAAPPAPPPPAPTSSRGGYRRVSEAAWVVARADYLEGDTAEEVCARFGMALSTFRARARAEGWRREDQPDPVAAPVDLPLETANGLPDYGQMAAHALVRLGRAVEAGRAIEAARWMRLHAELSSLASRGPVGDAADAPPPPPASPPTPAPRKEPDLADRATAVARQVGIIAREAAALKRGDFAGLDALMARAEALDDLKPPPISDDLHHSDGVFHAGESETGPHDILTSPFAKANGEDRSRPDQGGDQEGATRSSG